MYWFTLVSGLNFTTLIYILINIKRRKMDYINSGCSLESKYWKICVQSGTNTCHCILCNKNCKVYFMNKRNAPILYMLRILLIIYGPIKIILVSVMCCVT